MPGSETVTFQPEQALLVSPQTDFKVKVRIYSELVTINSGWPTAGGGNGAECGGQESSLWLRQEENRAGMLVATQREKRSFPPE